MGLGEVSGLLDEGEEIIEDFSVILEEDVEVLKMSIKVC